MHNKPAINKKPHILRRVSLCAAYLLIVLLLSGCSIGDMIQPVMHYFSKEASLEEATAPVLSQDALAAVPVRNAAGELMTRPDGEPVTVWAAYETATGGELKRDASGEPVTYPLGEIETYAPSAPILQPDGEYMTYAGGEPVTDILGFQKRDRNGESVTRAAGEVVTRGEDAIIYDTSGQPVRSQGEPVTCQSGEFLYNTNGEPVTYPVAVQKDRAGEPVTMEDGSVKLNNIEIVTDAAGDPVMENPEEAATRQLEPQPPVKKIDSPLEAGSYYVKNVTSAYQFFGAVLNRAGDIPISVEEGEDAEAYAPANKDELVTNVQMQLPREEIACFDVTFDPEGYAVFTLQGTNKVLTAAGKLRNGVNVALQDQVDVIYPQYKYWDDPLTTVADNQKWIIQAEDDGTFRICSALDPSYVMTASDQWGVRNANIILWQYDGRDLQKFDISTDMTIIERYVEEGSYAIRCLLTDWMLISLGDGNYTGGTHTFLSPSDQGDGQQFYVTYDEYGYAVIYHGDSDMVLSIPGGNAYDNQQICQYPYDGGDWQKWIIEPSKHGGYNIRSLLDPNHVIDLNDGQPTRDQEVHIYHDNSTLAQCWEFETDPIPPAYAFGTMDEYAQHFSSLTDYLILISSDTNHVGVYQGYRGNWENLFYWDCVTGKQATPTVKGEFTIYAKSDSFDGNMDSPAWYTVYNCSMFFPDYFFHSIIYNYHSWTIMDATMGVNASHGCVRLATENAQWIHDYVPMDTKVVSY